MEGEEQCSLDTNEPAPLLESDPGSDDTLDVPVIFHKAVFEALRLCCMQNPYPNVQKGEELGDLLYRYWRDIEGLHGLARST